MLFRSPVTVNARVTFVAEVAPLSVTLVAPAFAAPGTLTVAPEMTPSPFARTVLTASPFPKVIVTASFGAKPEPSTMIDVARGPEDTAVYLQIGNAWFRP